MQSSSEEEKQYWKDCAKAALTGIMSFTTQTDWVGEHNDLKDPRPVSEQVAELATELADAMLKEYRGKFEKEKCDCAG